MRQHKVARDKEEVKQASGARRRLPWWRIAITRTAQPIAGYSPRR
jgi:hypothetical protein